MKRNALPISTFYIVSDYLLQAAKWAGNVLFSRSRGHWCRVFFLLLNMKIGFLYLELGNLINDLLEIANI